MNTDQKIERMLDLLQRVERNSRPKDHWVGARWIQELTGWTGKKLAAARKDGVIEWQYTDKKNNSGPILHLLSSLPKEFIRKKEQEVSGEPGKVIELKQTI